MIDKRVHSGRAAEHRFQIREGGERVEIRMHECEIFDVLYLAGIRPNANCQIGKLFLERLAPGRRVADMLVQLDDEKRHATSAASDAELPCRCRRNGGVSTCSSPM